jgi:GMP synthase-like glutamine amidotransferase
VDVLRLIARAAEQDIPVLGLCLGAQLASLALGGRVSRRPDGFCIGWRPVVLANHDSLTAALPCCAELLHWHQDHFDLPPGSVPLMLGSDAFRLGSVAGIQAHPEVNVSLLRRWLARDGARDRLAQAKVTATEILEGAKRHDGHGAALLGAWATEVERRTERGTQLP